MVMRSTNAEIAQAYAQQSAAAKRLQDDWRARVKADGPGVEEAVAAVMGGMDLYEAASRFRVDPAAVHKRTNYAREMGFSLDPSVQSRADWMTERDANRAGEYGQKIDTADPGSAGGRYRLINRPEGQQIYDSVGNAFIGVNMATPEMLQAVGLGDRPSTRPADAATLPGQVAAPVINGAVQNGVHGNPTQAERDLGTVSTLPGGATRPPAPIAAPVITPQSVQPQQRMALPRLQAPTIGLGSGMNPTDMFLALSGAGVAAPQFQQQGMAAPRMMVADAAQMQPEPGVRAPQVLMREDAPVAAPQPDGMKIRALSATSPGGGTAQPQQEDQQTPPDPGGGAVFNPKTGQWEAPGGTSNAGNAGGGPAGGSQGRPGEIRTEPLPDGRSVDYEAVAYQDDNGNTVIRWERVGNPYYPREDPSNRQPTPRDAAATGQDNANAANAWANANATNTLLPAQLEQALANAGLTKAQTQALLAKLPGDLLKQAADTAAVWAAIDVAAKTLNLNVDKFSFEKGLEVAKLTGQYGDQATMDRIKMYGYDAQGNPTLDTSKFLHDKELNYANSRRADMLAGVTRSNTSGYMDDGSATLEREKLYADTDIANMAALSDRAYKAAQVALAQGDQAEAQRQFDISHELKNRIESADLALRQQAAEREWRQNPSSFLDQAWASRGMAAPTFQAQAQPQAQIAPTPAVAAPRMMAEPAPAGMMAAPTFQPQQAQPDGRGVIAAPQMQQQASNVPAAMRPLNFDEIERSGSNLPGLSAAFKGEEQRNYQTAGGVPRLSAQRLNSLNSTERSGLDALLKATGNDSQTYLEESQKLSRVGEGPQQFRQRSVAAPRLY